MDLAKRLGVEGRCTWVVDYVSEEEAANLFTASDAVLLTYDRTFRSASGVLNVAARYRRPVIASSGAGSLRSVVQRYGLGVWVEPDDADALASGFKDWLVSPPSPQWGDYNEDNSWHKNAQVVARAMGLKTTES